RCGWRCMRGGGWCRTRRPSGSGVGLSRTEGGRLPSSALRAPSPASGRRENQGVDAGVQRHSLSCRAVSQEYAVSPSSLPDPSPEAVAHSARLQELVRARIDEAGGAIPFREFMELALYAPGLGYYRAGASKVGAEGHFVTAPALGPIFAAGVSEASAPVLQQIGPQARLLELGGGTGAFAEVALKRLLELDALPDRYCILEPS